MKEERIYCDWRWRPVNEVLRIKDFSSEPWWSLASLTPGTVFPHSNENTVLRNHETCHTTVTKCIVIVMSCNSILFYVVHIIHITFNFIALFLLFLIEQNRSDQSAKMDINIINAYFKCIWYMHIFLYIYIQYICECMCNYSLYNTCSADILSII